MNNNQYWKLFFQNGLIALAAISSFITMLTFLVNWKPEELSCSSKVILSLLILSFIYFYANWYSKSKKNVTIKLTDNLKVNINSNNLFDSSNFIVIPVNEYFDSLVDDVIISKKSLHGQFIEKVYNNDFKKARNDFDEQLDKLSVVPKNERNSSISNLPIKKYPLGTAICIKHENIQYLLVAFTHFNNDNKAYIEIEEIQTTLVEIINQIDKFANSNSISIPVFGTGHSRINISKKRMLQYLLLVLELSHDKKSYKQINISINKDAYSDFDLNLIEDLYK